MQEQRRVEPPQANVPIPQQHQHEVDQRQLFPHPPIQCFQAPEIPPMGMGQMRL